MADWMSSYSELVERVRLWPWEQREHCADLICITAAIARHLECVCVFVYVCLCVCVGVRVFV